MPYISDRTHSFGLLIFNLTRLDTKLYRKIPLKSLALLRRFRVSSALTKANTVITVILLYFLVSKVLS